MPLESKEKDTEKDKTLSLRLNRRQKGSSSPLPSNPDLLAIPGVGPRNLRKLVQKGIAGVAELKQLYKDKVLLFFVSFMSPCHVFGSFVFLRLCLGVLNEWIEVV